MYFRVQVADCNYNIAQIEKMMRRAADKGVQMIAFPELSITAYTCMDLFSQETLLRDAEKALIRLVDNTADLPLLAFVGLPLRTNNRLINAAVAIQQGEIIGVVPKTYLPNYKEFQEKRWFTSANDLPDDIVQIGGDSYPMQKRILFCAPGCTVGVEICEDLWMPVPPSSELTMLGADIIFNLSASNELIGKHAYRRQLVAQQSARCLCGYVYASSGFGESTTDLVFSGSSLIAENGTILAESERFSLDDQLIVSEIDVEYLRHDRMVSNNFASGMDQADTERGFQLEFELPQYTRKEVNALTRPVSPFPFTPKGKELDDRCEEIFQIQMVAQPNANSDKSPVPMTNPFSRLATSISNCVRSRAWEFSYVTSCTEASWPMSWKCCIQAAFIDISFSVTPNDWMRFTELW